VKPYLLKFGIAKNLVKKMKPYLPMYYRKDNRKRSSKQIKNYHLLERWRMGCEVVEKYHDQAKKKLKLILIILKQKINLLKIKKNQLLKKKIYQPY
jgi:hypothetical protein